VRHLNLGGSVNLGREDDPLEPNVLRTAERRDVSPNADNVSPTFLRFNDGVAQRGGTAFWSGDAAWFYRNWTALAAYNGGFITYATAAQEGVRVPFEGGSGGGDVLPHRGGDHHPEGGRAAPRLRLARPARAPGGGRALLPVAYLNAGANLFAAGLADPRLWSNDALVLDNGVNWYLNRYVRVFLDWQHSEFVPRSGSGRTGSPTRPTSSGCARSSTTDPRLRSTRCTTGSGARAARRPA